ncbi:MAG: rhomboid family intramembrane serine protease [Bacteroidales bacterium]|jgi:membrane associated rhomboid family serine protease|nr:rhomboid family intramembrane serine protease [Bacteroidales bacterium]HPB02871.1 rhomboid family intramembrane serine protease [Bacteroidales bacterium]
MSITLILIIVTVAVSLIAFSNRILFAHLLFYPYEIKRENQWYRFITHGFIHADFMHLFINMWVLYIFGEVVEKSLKLIYGNEGTLYFMLLYFGGLIFSSMYSYGRHLNNPQYSALGASGAVSGITFAYILMYPMSGLMIFPIPIQLPAFIFGILYLIYSWYMGRRGKDNIGHDAHFFGALYGVIFMIILDYRFVTLFLSNFR